MTKIYFIRHGKTKWNLESRYQGMHGDSPLLPESYDEIDLLARSLKDINFVHAYASPIKRAMDTALRLIAGLSNPVDLTLMSQFSEFDLGKMEGMHFDAVGKEFPAALDAFRNHPDKYDASIVGGESFEQLIRRFAGAIEEIVQVYPRLDDNLIVVSHGAALNAAINALLGVPLANLRDRGGLSNTSTTVLETNDGGQQFELIKWNDTSYLHHQLDATDTI